jgi:hypothetical protein
MFSGIHEILLIIYFHKKKKTLLNWYIQSWMLSLWEIVLVRYKHPLEVIQAFLFIGEVCGELLLSLFMVITLVGRNKVK